MDKRRKGMSENAAERVNRPRFATYNGLSAELGIHHQTLRRWVREREDFPAPVVLSPGAHRFEVEAVEKWIEQQRGAVRGGRA